jgi:putative PIN family toxin of toxin-antitoxin system
MKVILDTNIWISFLLGKRLNVLREIVDKEDVEIYISDNLLAELRDVAYRPKFEGLIGLDAILNLFELINAKCRFIQNYRSTESPIRGIKDLYLLSMAESIPADYLVTGDQDLLVLKNHKETPIITFSDFVSIVKSH